MLNVKMSPHPFERGQPAGVKAQGSSKTIQGCLEKIGWTSLIFGNATQPA